MPGVVVELGAGMARVGSARVRVAPAEGGALEVDGLMLRPLAFGDRARLVAEARTAGRERELGADVLALSSAATTDLGNVDRVILEALALHLAGARSDAHPAPGFSSAFIALTIGTGWTPLAAAAADAYLMDRLSEAVLSSLDTDGEGGWTRIEFGDAVANAPRGTPSDPTAVRDALVEDLLRREREAPSRAAAALVRAVAASGAAMSARGLEDADPTAATAESGTGSASSAHRATAPRPAELRPPAAPDDPGSAESAQGGRRSTRPVPRSSASEAIASLAEPGGGWPGPGTLPVPPEPIASGSLWHRVESPAANALSFGGSGGRDGRVAQQEAAASDPASWTTRLAVAGEGRPRSMDVPADLRPRGASSAAQPSSATRSSDVERVPLGFELRDLSDALAEVLDEESDLRGLEDA